MSLNSHYHHHYHFSYTTSFRRHFTSVLIVLAIILILLFIILQNITPQNPINFDQISIFQILLAAWKTITRLTFAYSLAMVLSIPLALLITSTKRVERILLPIFDIMQSIPVLAFFPVIVITFVQANFLEGAALFILVVAMMGSLVFSMIGGIKTIPYDITASSKVFGATGYKKLFYVTIPSIFPPIITGSLLAWSQAWSIIIVAEALHTYIPNGTPKNDLYGLGSLLVNAFSQGQNGIFIVTLLIMITVIVLLNYFIWQRLLHVAERFRFD
ncbi:hypothetical protein BH09PAT1_BH09PAT1_8690 [soil metagenome]